MTEVDDRIEDALDGSGWPLELRAIFSNPVTVESWRYDEGAKVLDEPDEEE